ncbi:hypothetical protein [Thermodesulfatator atlanticus]
MKIKHIFFVFCLLFFYSPLANAQETEETPTKQEEKGFLETLTEEVGSTAKEVLEEKIEEFKKGKRGKIASVKVIKEEPDHLVLEVSFKKVANPEEVYITGEVLRAGAPLSDFVVDRLPLAAKQGFIQLNVYYVEPETTDYAPVKTDQIRVYLYPSGEPDNRFGEYYLALVRDWGTPPQEEAITLAEEEPSAEQTSPEQPEAKPPLIKVPQPPFKGVAPKTPPAKEPPKKVITTFVTRYDFFANAHKAKWRSRYGDLPYPGKNNDRRGFARPIANGYLSTGNRAIKLLETHPAWEPRGWISGEYPVLLLGKGVHFKAVVGFLKGAKASDGALFKVYVKDDQNRKTRVFARYVSPDRYVHVDVDLSRYAGKPIALILYVNAWRTSAQDWAVWVAPRLTTR